MTKTAVALYDGFGDARHVIHELLDDVKVERNEIHLFSQSGDVSAADISVEDPGAIGQEGLAGYLMRLGVDSDEARLFEEGVYQGGSLVVLTVPDNKVGDATDIMNRYHPIDIEEKSDEWFSSNGRRRETRERSFATTDTRRTDESTLGMEGRTGAEGKETHKIDVVEEELLVGKQDVSEGEGVRVTTRTTETPVEKDITLREEHINVDRRKVDRDVSADDANLFKEEEFEVRGRREEPVVQKRARVIEEVIITKDVDTRTETIRDTIRRQDVDIDRLEGEFRTHYDRTFANRGDYSFDDYSKGYYYGASLGSHEDYRDREWRDIEPEARRSWEDRNQGTWDEFKDSVREGWDRIRR